MMKVTSKAIYNGIIQDKYGKRGMQFKNKLGEIKQQFEQEYMPTYSIPIKIEEAPDKTVSYCIYVEDRDAIPVCGFSWIHWAVANLTRNEIVENESLTATDFIQGVNSWYGAVYGFEKENATGYGGMTPPDREHKYHIHVYALDTILEIKNGFFVNELFEAIDGHVIDSKTICAIYHD